MYEIESGIPIPEGLDYRKCARCKNCAIEGMTICQECRDKQNVKNKLNYEKNKDSILKQSKKHYAENIVTEKAKRKEFRKLNSKKLSERQKEYAKNHKEHIAEYNKVYQKENLDKFRVSNRKHYAKNSEVVNSKQRQSYKENPEKTLVRQRTRYKNKTEEILAQSKVYRERTKDIASARQKEYRKNNKGIVYAWQLRRKTIKIDAFVEDFSREEIFERDDYTCQLCGEKVLLDVKHNHSAAPTIDHIVPLSKGGKHERINVQCAHYGCNVSKGNRAHKRADYVPDLY